MDAATIGEAGVALGPYAGMLEDPQAALTIEQVAALPDSRFTSVGRQAPNLGYTASAWWLKTEILVPPESVARYLLEFAVAFVDHADVYYPDVSGGWVRLEGGDHVPRARLNSNYPLYLYPIPERHGPIPVYLRLQGVGPLQVKFHLWREAALFDHALRTQLFHGMYYAVMLAMLVYNLLLFSVVRDRSYIYYVGYLGGICAFQATYYGHVQVYLWPAALPMFNPLSPCLLLFGAGVGMYFARTISDAAQHAPRMHRILGVAAWLILVFMGLLALFYSVLAPWVPLIAVISIGLIVHTLVVSSIAGSRSARLALLAFAAIAPGGLALALRYMGLVPANILSDHGLQIGTAVEAMLLSFVLADRINQLKRSRDQAQQALLESRQASLTQQKVFSRRLLTAQDTERRRIAQDLHDGVGQLLLSVVNGLTRMIKSPETGTLHRLHDIARQGVDDLRHISHDLHPHQLDRLGLVQAVKTAAGHLLRDTDTELRLELEDVGLSKARQLHLYRVTQEALSNIAKYAHAGTVAIVLRRQGQSIILQIKDDGRGFDPGVAAEGLGLRSMRERIEQLDGQITIDSQRGQGCRIHIDCPVAS